MPARRTPAKLHFLTTGQHRQTPNTGGFLDPPKPPDWLSREAKAEWRRVVKACSVYPTWLQAVDKAALAAYSASWGTFAEAQKDIKDRGVVVPGRSPADREILVRNPSVQIARDAQEAMRKWARELGFTPDSRGKLDVGDLRGDDLESVFDDDFDGPMAPYR